MEVKNRVIELIDHELEDLHQEMRELDKQYLDKQKRVRELRKARNTITEHIDYVLSAK